MSIVKPRRPANSLQLSQLFICAVATVRNILPLRFADDRRIHAGRCNEVILIHFCRLTSLESGKLRRSVALVADGGRIKVFFTHLPTDAGHD